MDLLDLTGQTVLITAGAVAPGIVAAALAQRQWASDPACRARAAKAIPLGYLQPPERVAHAFLFLYSPMARYPIA